jgi:DNA-binding transcriptional LysR family regulator
MEVRQIRYFCVVARMGSFTRATEEEGVAQPSLSPQILKLEFEMSAPLFERLGRCAWHRCGELLLLQIARELTVLDGVFQQYPHCFENPARLKRM